MPDTKDAIAALRRIHDQMVTLATGLSAAKLEAQSACTQWSVADVFSHLGSSAEIGLNTLDAGKADMSASPAIWDRWNALSSGDKAAEFVAAEERLVQKLESFDADTLADMKVDVGFLPMPIDIGFITAMRLGEMGLHGWDVEVISDPAATVPEFILPFVLAQLPMFAGFFAKPMGKTGRMSVTTTGPDRAYLLELNDEGASLEENPSPGGESQVALPAEAFVRLTAGRLGPDHTPASVTASGPLTLDDLRLVFPGY